MLIKCKELKKDYAKIDIKILEIGLKKELNTEDIYINNLELDEEKSLKSCDDEFQREMLKDVKHILKKLNNSEKDGETITIQRDLMEDLKQFDIYFLPSLGYSKMLR